MPSPKLTALSILGAVSTSLVTLPRLLLSALSASSILADTGASSSLGDGSSDVGLDVDAELPLPRRVVFSGENISLFSGIGSRWEMTFGC